MQRTNYWNQTRPTDTQLNWTETSRVNAINERLRSSAQMGVAWGFQVTVNSVDNTKIDIARGEGYSGGMFLVNEFETAGSGQRVSTYTATPSGVDDTGPAATSQALADYTLGVKNYVSLVYTETESYPLSERTYPFTNRETVVTETFTVSVLTETQWNALDSTALNNRILVGIVTAKGAGVALTSADIDQFVQPKRQPTASTPSALVGVTVVSLAEITPLGTAVIRWDASVSQLYYTAPGDVEGAGVTLADSGSFTLYSNNTNYSIVVNVNFSALSVVASQSENISISSLYGRTIPMFSAVDQIHRDMLGSGQPTKTNPHALTINDLGGGGFDHADLFHVNGISVDAAPTQLECQIDFALDRVVVPNLGGFSNSFLVDGNTWETINGLVAGVPGYVTFGLTDDAADYLIYLDSNAALHKVKIAGYTEGKSPEWPFWDTNIALIDMHNEIAGNGVVTWDAAAETLTYQSPADAGPGAAVRLIGDTAGVGYWGYYKLFSLTTTDWIIVYVNGALGANNSSTIAIVKDETTYSDEIMLKLCVVNWEGSNAGSGHVTDLRDIRNYITADVKDRFEQEHTPEGYHIKPFRNALRVAHDSDVGVSVQVANSGMIANADTESAVVGNAVTYGVMGNADTYGVYGIAAANTGVYGSAAVIYGGYFKAPNSALYAEAPTATAIYASAQNYGINATANVAVAVRAVAADTAISASAGGAEAVSGTALVTAIIGKANGTGVYGTAANDKGVVGAAPDTAVYGIADNEYGGYFEAPNTVLFATAATDTAIYGYASNGTGVYGRAQAVGVSGTANSIYGGYFKASNSALCGIAGVNIGIYGRAVADTGAYATASRTAIYGVAAGSFGIYGTAAHLAGYFQASSDWAADTVIGLYGQGINGVSANQAIGIEGYVAGNDATGIYGLANVSANGAGVLGSNPGTYGTAIVGIATGVSGTGIYAKGTIGGVFSVPDPGGYPLSLSCPTNTVATMTVVASNVPIIINGTALYFKVYTD